MFILISVLSVRSLSKMDNSQGEQPNQGSKVWWDFVYRTFPTCNQKDLSVATTDHNRGMTLWLSSGCHDFSSPNNFRTKQSSNVYF